MLIRFAIENWMSFRERAEFSMVAGKERQHGERLTHVKKYRLRVSPVAAVYGGNASGKTNLFRALAFTKRLVVLGTQPDTLIPVESFMLDSPASHEPSRFSFEILIDDVVYDYRFALTADEVLEESLTRILSTSETVLFQRSGQSIAFPSARGRLQFLEFAFQGTRANELFLTNAVSQNVNEYRPVWLWFRDTLTLIAPDTAFGPFELLADETNPLSSDVSEALEALDTGIHRLAAKDVEFEDIGLPPEVASRVRQMVKPDTTLRFRDILGNERYVFSLGTDGAIRAWKLLAGHLRPDGSEVLFELRREAGGSQRVIDLLPAFCELSDPRARRVYVIDELDRSLHTLLTRQLLSSFLDACGPSTRSQLVFTTHDLLLMDQDMFRRDEMWVTERNEHGGSAVFSLSEYQEIRYDKDIRKSYLQGRLGGVPRLLYRQTCAADVPVAMEDRS